MGSGKQWSVDTVRKVKTLMSSGLPLPRISAKTGVVLQMVRSFSARVKKGFSGDKHGSHRGARSKQTDEMRSWVSDHLIAKPNASVAEVHFEFQRVWFSLVTNTAASHHAQPAPTRETNPHAQGLYGELQASCGVSALTC